MTYVAHDFPANLKCPDGQYITALCGSGGERDCGGNAGAILGCTSYTDLTAVTSNTETVSQGRIADCRATGVVSGVCISGENNDCDGKGTEAVCVSTVDNAFTSKGTPTWNVDVGLGTTTTPDGTSISQAGNQGDHSMGCPTGWVVTGVCNAGNNPGTDCPSTGAGGYTHLKCGKLRNSQHMITALLSIDDSIQICPATLDANTSTPVNRTKCANQLCSALGSTSTCACLNDHMPNASAATQCCETTGKAAGCVPGQWLGVEPDTDDAVFTQALASASVTNLLKRFSATDPPYSVATCCKRTQDGTDLCDEGVPPMPPNQKVILYDCKPTDPIYASLQRTGLFSDLTPIDTRNLPDNVEWSCVTDGWMRKACLSVDDKCINAPGATTVTDPGCHPPDNRADHSAIPPLNGTYWKF